MAETPEENKDEQNLGTVADAIAAASIGNMADTIAASHMGKIAAIGKVADTITASELDTIPVTLKRHTLLSDLIKNEINNLPFAYLYNYIMTNIKKHNNDIDEAIDSKQVSEEDWINIYTSNGDKYIEINKLIGKLVEANEELWFDYCVKIETLLLELISEVFPHMTDKIFDSVHNQTIAKIGTDNITDSNIQLFLDYTNELKKEAKRLSKPIIKEELSNNIPLKNNKSVEDTYRLYAKIKKLEENTSVEKLTENLETSNKVLKYLQQDRTEIKKY